MKNTKMSKLEKFVWCNQNTTFEALAAQTNRTIGAIERAADRAEKKWKASQIKTPGVLN